MNRKKAHRRSRLPPPRASYGSHVIGPSDVSAVDAVLRSENLTQGPAVPSFEKHLANYCGAPHAVAVSSGTAALHTAFMGAGIGEGDEVITTPNTFVATTNMLLALKAKPVFCDIRIDTWNIDESKIESLITSRTKAIVPVHFAGNPCAMDAILRIARAHNLHVIEDAAQALGAEYKGKKIGSLNSMMTVFSFHPVKSITTGEGGAIMTADPELYGRLSLLRTHGTTKSVDGFNVMTMLGFNYRLTDIQAALGISQMKRLDSRIARRRALAAAYYKALSNIEDILLPQETVGAASAWHLYVIRVVDEKKRMDLANHLRKHGVGINFHYPAVYSHPYYRSHGWAGFSLPNADAHARSCITIPLHARMSTRDVAYVAKIIKQFFTGNRI